MQIGVSFDKGTQETTEAELPAELEHFEQKNRESSIAS